MIAAGDFDGDPRLEFGDCHRCCILRVVVPAGGDIRGSRARQEVNATHQGSDQTLDMATEMWPRDRAEDLLDSVFITPTPHRLRPKLSCVVHVKGIWNPPLIPFCVDVAL